MIQIEERDVESVLTSMTSSFCLHLQFPGSSFLRNSDLVAGEVAGVVNVGIYVVCRYVRVYASTVKWLEAPSNGGGWVAFNTV